MSNKAPSTTGKKICSGLLSQLPIQTPANRFYAVQASLIRVHGSIKRSHTVRWRYLPCVCNEEEQPSKFLEIRPSNL